MMNPTPEQLQQEFLAAEEKTSENLRTPQAEKDKRLAICSTCEYKTTMFTLDACSECNCLLGFKIPLVSSNCPRGKW